MGIRIEEYTPAHIPGVRSFNQRIKGSIEPELLFPEEPRMDWLPAGAHPTLFQQGYVAVDGGFVHGAYILKQQEFLAHGKSHVLASYRLPISEGICNRAYAATGLLLIRDALARQPLLFSLGMGAIDRPLPKIQKALGWQQCLVPFLFKVLRGGTFARNIRVLRNTRSRRVLLDVAAATALASTACAVRNFLTSKNLGVQDLRIEEFREFGVWADHLWAKCGASYSLVAVRNRDTLNTLYRPDDGRFLRWKMMRGDEVVGWALAIDTLMQDHKQFGSMRVATIVDGFADPADAGLVGAAAALKLEQRGPDIMISNQANIHWCRGLLATGFLEGPSNFIFSASPSLSKLLEPFEDGVRSAHLNRGDGDGPVHL